MRPDAPDSQLLWQKTSLLLYQSGEAQALIQSGADRSEVQECLAKVLTLAGEALVLTASIPESRSTRSPIQAVITAQQEPPADDLKAA